ncbi:hypothetical protein ACT453_25770, partial [Bacillus sp. D-CC]
MEFGVYKEIDLKNPKSNRKNPGFSDEEREKFTNLLEEGFIDTFRLIYDRKASSHFILYSKRSSPCLEF